MGGKPRWAPVGGGRWTIRSVPPDLPVAVADRFRGEGVAIEIDARDGPRTHRRAKTPAELLPASAALSAPRRPALAVAEELIRGAERYRRPPAA